MRGLPLAASHEAPLAPPRGAPLAERLLSAVGFSPHRSQWHRPVAAFDGAQFVAGINEYVNEARLDPAKMPGEYAAIGRPLGSDPWTPADP